MTSLGYFFTLALMATGLALYVILIFGFLLWLVGVFAQVTKNRPSMPLQIALVGIWTFLLAMGIFMPFALFAS